MSDLRSSNIYDMLDEDGGASASIPKKDAKGTPADKPSSKKVDAPPKKERAAKSEEPAAPVGKDQRGSGRDPKPRGRGRDNKGGLRKPAGSGREFDRRSGPAGSHRNAPRDGKRSDRGKGNWGNEVDESTLAAQKAEDPATPASPPPAEDNKTEATATTEVKDAEQKEEAKPEEEEDKTVTYDQFIKIKEAKAPEGDKLEARAVEVDETQWKVANEVVSEKKKKKNETPKDDDKDDKTGKTKKKNIVTWDEFVAAGPARPARESRPRAETTGSEPRGRGRGRGGVSRGARGGASRGRGRGHAPEFNSEESFPKLGK